MYLSISYFCDPVLYLYTYTSFCFIFIQIQNSRLESDLIKLRGELQKMEENTSARIKAALLESEKTIRRLRDDENRSIAFVCIILF